MEGGGQPRWRSNAELFFLTLDANPRVAQHTVCSGISDFVGFGEMVLAYPELAADVLEGRPLQREKICRTFSHYATGPRLGLISGCYPLDDFYKSHPQGVRLTELK